MNKEEQSLIYSRNINSYICKYVINNKKILDIGCNTGSLGEKLIKEKNCIVYGIDCSKKAIEIAKRRLNKAIVFDLETYKLPFKNEKFDIIIFGDVLEHSRYPEEIMREYAKLLNKRGLVIASIPNVANIEIRFKLLFGNWNYEEEGILDKTHLRFFTNKTIVRMFKESGYKILKIDSSPGFSFLFLKYLGSLKKIREILCKIYPKLFALQFIVIAELKNETKI